MALKLKPAVKPSRTETVTVRLDPQLRYMAEIAARKQRRSLSSYIEWAVEYSLKQVKLYEGSGYNANEDVTVQDEAARLWDVDDAERFIRLAIYYPALLTQEEQERWKMLSDSQLLAPARQRDISGNVVWNSAELEDRVYPAVRMAWPAMLIAHAEGKVSSAAWVASTRRGVETGETFPGFKPKHVVPKSSSGFDDMDDEVPF